jgi:hypothetical protein
MKVCGSGMVSAGLLTRAARLYDSRIGSVNLTTALSLVAASRDCAMRCRTWVPVDLRGELERPVPLRRSAGVPWCGGLLVEEWAT